MLEGQQDLGEFNDSTVFFQPSFSQPRTVPALKRHTNTELNSLGIYEPIKLTSLIQSKQGELIEFISYAEHSHNTFVTNQAINLLQRYSTDELSFVVVVGDHQSGKSFLCDKILNLSQIKGNHFCRRNNKGINIWSTPFDKDDLKIFLLEISNCSMESYEFKLLATYTLMIGSAFVVVEGMKNQQKTSIQKMDEVMSQITAKIGSNMERLQNESIVYTGILPKLFYNLYRPSTRKVTSSLKSIAFHASQMLPDALVKTYTGSSQHLTQLPILDTKCISEQYIKRVSSIFKDIYSKISQKRYKELVLNGNIVAKVVKYIQTYLNNKSELNIQKLYIQIIQDLYQSAYNYCILHYHQQMQQQFQDQKPKDFQELLLIFQRISDDTFSKFQQFNLDQRLYHHYYQKLQEHITSKEHMIMDINANKSEQIMNSLYDSENIGNKQVYQHLVERLNSDYSYLTHGRDQFLGKVNSQFYTKTKGSNNVDYLIMKEIQRIKEMTSEKIVQLQSMELQNQKFSKNKQMLVSNQRKADDRINQLNRELEKAMRMSIVDVNTQKRQIAELQKKISQNQNTIDELRKDKGKHKKVTQLEMQIDQVQKKIKIQQNLLQQLNESKMKTEDPKDKA